MALLLPDLLSYSANRWPEDPAIVMDAIALSYSELEAASNRFARALVRSGVGHGDRVALWLPKSPEAAVALYGVMKAGAAYVAVDPSAPPARLAYIARDCQVAGVVTLSTRFAALGREFAGDAPMRVVLHADTEADPVRLARLPTISWAEINQGSPEPLSNPAKETDLAYILYTSGSTGEPKGVMISHRSSLSFVEWAGDTFAITREDRMANHAGFHFDLSVFDLFAGARAGATVYPVSPRVAPFPAALSRQWSDQRLTVWYATPSTLIQLLARGNLSAVDLSALRLVLFAGEVFPVKHLRQLMALVPRARFANLYGPTETNVCTWYEVQSLPSEGSSLPIGRSCSNCQVLLLDEAGLAVRDGEVGELWVSGGTLMHGYWGRPELTARALKEIEVSPGQRKRAYRTGDLVRRLGDGDLQFVGRRDHQVKTRGYRVELGEIEAMLSRHPAVDESVVLAVPDEEIGHRLKAVVVPNAGKPVDEAELKRHCSEVLPRYMIPEMIEFRSNLPRTGSDKVDREALLRLALGVSKTGRAG